jgi:hypothetical protein
VLALAATACSSGVTSMSDYPCPPGGTKLTYDDFGRGFLAANCQVCHGQPSNERRGAPPEVDFHSRDEVVRWKERIFVRAAANNTSMPPGPDDPPEQDRYMLADWLACGAP